MSYQFQLEQEKVRLNRDLQGERSKTLSKSGEADTLRRRAETAARENEQRLQALQQSHHEAVTNIKTELEKMRREREQAQTNNMFLEHDLAREADRTRKTRKAVSSRSRPANTAVSPGGTPKRAQKTLPLRDGFDDEDMIMASPTKTREKSRVSTPKQAGKRKRNVADQSPIAVLQLSEPRERPKALDAMTSFEQSQEAAPLRNLWGDDRRFALLHRLLSHRSSNGTDRILEALTLYALPSQPHKRLSSLVHDSLSAPQLSADVHKLALRICHTFLSLWKQCLDEKYYPPLYLILDALHFVLAWESSKTAVAITEQALPLIIASVDLITIPIGRAAKREVKDIGDLYSPDQRKITSEIDVARCLQLLYLIAASCLSFTSPDAIARFWRAMPSDFVLILLIKEQPLPYITLMLRVLGTSALPASLGPMVAQGGDSQAKREADLVHRLTNLLSETPQPIPDPEAPDGVEEVRAADIWNLRLQTLDVLAQFSIQGYGSARLANHRSCIGRLIKFLDFSIALLYSEPLSPTQKQKIAGINSAMKLIYHLVKSNNGFDIKTKLVGILGGHHAYLVALTRLAFSDGLVLEAGIEDAVVDMAHSILDEGLSLEEGEGLVQVFSSGNSA